MGVYEEDSGQLLSDFSRIPPHKSLHPLQGLRRRGFQIADHLSQQIPICQTAYPTTEAETRRFFYHWAGFPPNST